MKWGIYLSILSLVLGVFALTYGDRGPYCSIEPFRAPFSFSDQRTQQFEFIAHCTGLYQVQISYREPEDPADLVPLLGDYARRQPGALKELEWELVRAGNVVARGVGRDHRYSPTSGVTVPETTIGFFEGFRHADYLLRVRSQNVEPAWNFFSPFIVVRLDPFVLSETQLSWVFLGEIITVASGISLLLFGACFYYSRQHGC